ncbi:hypothetical protein AB1Y20_012808 [Prymnesium parvum]|uniref:Rab3 GTPase-activating protein catalytic subunit n=1 Tax=Prymnesium parvum TaxID=97485 RepID=A0AB34ILD1_PRYPA|mmetsp:Transcript_23728/g.58889  ORF Transcript_23728/g.58889 Transcript_23728/m.58889 type:complete len:131 (+) Transcript_23728:54-446(+)
MSSKPSDAEQTRVPQLHTMAGSRRAWGNADDDTTRSPTMDDLHVFLSSYSPAPEHRHSFDDFWCAEADLFHANCSVPESVREENDDQVTPSHDEDDSSDEEEFVAPERHWAPLLGRRLVQGPRASVVSGG